MEEVLYAIYMSLLFFLSLLAIYRYRVMDIGTRFISGFIWLGLSTETTARIVAVKYGNNMPVHNIACIIEFVLISLYFNYSISDFRHGNKGIFIAACGVSIGIINHLKFQSLNKINSNFLFLECVGIVCMSLYAIYRMLKVDDDNLRLYRKIQFWIPVILILYQCGALWSWVMYDYYRETDKSAIILLQCLLLTNCIITYCLLSVFYLLYPKLKVIYV